MGEARFWQCWFGQCGCGERGSGGLIGAADGAIFVDGFCEPDEADAEQDEDAEGASGHPCHDVAGLAAEGGVTTHAAERRDESAAASTLDKDEPAKKEAEQKKEDRQDVEQDFHVCVVSDDQFMPEPRSSEPCMLPDSPPGRKITSDDPKSRRTSPFCARCVGMLLHSTLDMARCGLLIYLLISRCGGGFADGLNAG